MQVRIYSAKEWLQSIRSLGYTSFFMDQLHEHGLYSQGLLQKAKHTGLVREIKSERAFRKGHIVKKWEIL